MTRFEIKGNTIVSENQFGKDTFEIVDKIPAGFFVWNIGENMGSDEYIPLAQDLHPEDKENYEIKRETLKAIKLNTKEVKALRKAAGWGITSKKAAEKALKSKRKGYISNHKREEAAATIEIYNRITS